MALLGSRSGRMKKRRSEQRRVLIEKMVNLGEVFLR